MGKPVHTLSADAGQADAGTLLGSRLTRQQIDQLADIFANRQALKLWLHCGITAAYYAVHGFPWCYAEERPENEARLAWWPKHSGPSLQAHACASTPYVTGSGHAMMSDECTYAVGSSQQHVAMPSKHQPTLTLQEKQAQSVSMPRPGCSNDWVGCLQSGVGSADCSTARGRGACSGAGQRQHPSPRSARLDDTVAPAHTMTLACHQFHIFWRTVPS